MSTRAQVDWEDENGELEARTTRSRRALLGGAAGGFALAASGLVLPEWLVEEAEAADNHPARRILERKERQRAKRGDDRHHRHQRRRRPSKHHKRGDIVPTHPAITVFNNRAAPVQTRGLQNTQSSRGWEVRDGWDWAEIRAKGDGSFRDFYASEDPMVVQIGTDRLVWFSFDWPFPPQANIRSGGWESNGWNPEGERLAEDHNMFINDSISAPGIKATRIEDSNRHVQLRVELT